MKIEFHCTTCGTDFEMGEAYLGKKDKIICPTCGNEFPDEILSPLKDGIDSVEKAYQEQKRYVQTAGPGKPMIFHLKVE